MSALQTYLDLKYQSERAKDAAAELRRRLLNWGSVERKPTVAAGYPRSSVQLVHAASLYIATKLGDLRDDVVIVGGLVRSLIVPRSLLPPGKLSLISAAGLSEPSLDRPLGGWYYVTEGCPLWVKDEHAVIMVPDFFQDEGEEALRAQVKWQYEHLVQVSHILATFRERPGRYFCPVGRVVMSRPYRELHRRSDDHPARLRRSVICASQVFI